MSRYPKFSVLISSQIPEEDREDLLRTIRQVMELRQLERQEMIAEWLIFVAIVKDVGILAGSAAAIVKLVNEITAWRDRVRAKKGCDVVRLKGAGQSELDLSTATVQEIKEWFSKTKVD